jgi:hypothetical protein
MICCATSSSTNILVRSKIVTFDDGASKVDGLIADCLIHQNPFIQSPHQKDAPIQQIIISLNSSVHSAKVVVSLPSSQAFHHFPAKSLLPMGGK